MRMRCALLAACAGLVLVPGAAFARQMQVVDSRPHAMEVIDGNHAQFSLRFDGPVDHRQSIIQVLDDKGVAVRTMHPLLDSAPDVLFASGPGLPAGSYQLKYVVRSLPDGDITSGSLPFSVKN
ncbi:MAG: copper resistance protein CopC [Proteobacteria bacterium]|nr:copper resistance protein CopC [Pseudomonadota bacterium]